MEYLSLDCTTKNITSQKLTLKMIFAEHSSNNGKNKISKKTSSYGNILNKGRKNLSRLKL